MTNASAQQEMDEIPFSDEEQIWISDNPTVRVASTYFYAPFAYVSAGRQAGLSIDYINLIFEKIGIRPEYVSYEEFPEALAGAIEGEVDIVHSFSKTQEREKTFLFSQPYYSETFVNFGRASAPRVNGPEDLVSLRIGIVTSHIVAETYKRKYPQLNYFEYSNYMEATGALLAGEIDVFTAERSTTDFYLSENNIQGLEVVGDDFVMENELIEHHIAVLPHKYILIGIIDKAMAAITPDEYKRIVDKWIGQEDAEFDLELTGDELNWLEANNTIIVSAEASSPPYEFINDDGNIDGLTGDFLNEISKRLNIDFVWAGNENWDEGLEKVRVGEADLVTGITPTPDREEYLTFSDFYISYETAIFSRLDATHFANLESLNGYSVAQVTGTAEVSYLRQFYPDIQIIEVDRYQEAIELVSNGGADAFTGTILSTSPAILEANIENLIISGIADYDFGSAIGTRKDLTYLASAVQKALMDIDPARRQEIINKWTLLRFIPSTDYAYLWNVLGVAFLILVVALIWNRKLTVARIEALEAKREAEQANASKTMFLANMSHELRTPLNSLLLLAQNLRKNSGENLTEEQVEHVNVIHNSGTELLQLINEILDLSKIEANQMVASSDEIMLEDISGYIIQVFKPVMDEINLEFSVEVDDALPNGIVCDQQYLYQIMKNLISNAIKFTDQGSIAIAIDHYVLEEENIEQIKFSVTDTGIGVSADVQEDIFNSFSQGDRSTSRNYGGTGLGLSISAKLAELMGGNIKVESRLGIGSTFCLYLPLVTPNAMEETQQAEGKILRSIPLAELNSPTNDNITGLEGKTILLVDDDEKNIFSLSEILNKYGIKSIVANSGIKALESLKKHGDIDLVLMDMMMPGMDGDEAISRIRFTARGEHLPIISLTANALPKYRQKCLDAGANDYLTKPIDIDTLLSKMQAWI